MRDEINICLINPNTSIAMTIAIEAGAKSVASSNTRIIAVNPDSGPISIEGYYDEVFSLPGLLTKVKEHKDSDAFIIACFDDTGLDAARAMTNKPVLGIGQSACYIASMLSETFGVITTLDISVPILKNNIYKMGFSKRCTSVTSVEIPVLDLEKQSKLAIGKIRAEISRLICEKKVESIVLGCAGMVEFANSLEKEFSIPIIEGVSAATVLSEGIVKMNKSTSKIGGYAFPRQKEYIGEMKKFEFKK